MKKFIAMMLIILSVALVPGCGKRENAAFGNETPFVPESAETTEEAEKPETEENAETSGKIVLIEKNTSAGNSSYSIQAKLAPKTSNEFSQGIHDMTAEEWQTYHSLSEAERWSSSHLWGECTQLLETWEDATALVGFPVENPLEEADWLLEANYVAILLEEISMEEYRKHVEVAWSSQEDGTIRSLRISSGYLEESVRVQMTVTFTGGEDFYRTGSAWAEEVEFLTEEYVLEDGNTALLITPEMEGNYCSVDAYFVKNGALYQFHLVGKTGEEETVRATMEKVLGLFE